MLIVEKRNEYERYLMHPFVFVPYQLDYIYVSKNGHYVGNDPTHMLASLTKVFENDAAALYTLNSLY